MLSRGWGSQVVERAALRGRGRALLVRGALPAAALLGWMLLLALANPNWLYLNASGFPGAWFRFGAFHNLRETTRLYGELPPFGAQLAWTLPGYLAHKLLPLAAANLALRLGLFLTTTLAVYGALALLVGRRAGLLMALLLGGYSHVLLAIGWDYGDGAATAYFALCVALLTLAARRPRGWLPAAAAGGAAAALVSAAPHTALLLPALGLFYVLLTRGRAARLRLLGLAAALLGGLCALALLGGASRALGGSWWPLPPRLGLGAPGLEEMPLPAALAQGHLLWPNLALLASALCLALPRLRARLADTPQAKLLLLLHIAAQLSLLGGQLATGAPLLGAFSLASPLAVTTALALGALLGPALASLGRGAFLAMLGLGALLTLLALWLRSCAPAPAHVVLQALILGLVWLALWAARPARLWLLPMFLVIFCAATPTAFADSPQATVCRAIRSDRATLAGEYQAVRDGFEQIKAIAPGSRPLFWYSQAEAPFYAFFPMLYPPGDTTASERFPERGRPDGQEWSAPPGSRVVVLSQRPDAQSLAAAELQRLGRTVRALGGRRLAAGAAQFELAVFELAPETLDPGQSHTISFAEGADPGRFLRAGWSRPAGGSTWTIGRRAELEIPFDTTPAGPIRLELAVASSAAQFAPPGSSLQVHMSVNAAPLGTLTLSREQPGGELAVLVPAEVAARARGLTVALDIDRPYAPAASGYNEDRRELGLAVAALRLVPQP
jgi:hypothetical protein